MAQFDTTGLDELINQMQRLGQDEGPVAEEMVNAASDIIVEEWKASCAAHGHIRTGAMMGAIKPGPGPKRSGGAVFRDIYPKGSDANGTRNAEKAFILNYGCSRFPGSYWVEEAEDNASGPAQEACEEIWERFIASAG